MLTEEQKSKRCNGIGASDSSIIMGYNHYKTTYQLYLEKIGMVENEEEESELQYWGNALEPLIIKRFADENNLEVTFPDTVYHPDYPYIFANLDGFIPSQNAVLEAKNVNSFQRKEWDLALNDGIPFVYLIQIAKQVAIMNADKGYCAVLIGGNEYKQFIYQRDKALEELILESDKHFWNCVVNRIEPESSNTSDCRLKYRTPNSDKCVQVNHRIGNVLADLINLKSSIKRYNEDEEQLKMQLMTHMKDAEYLIDLDGEVIATWKANKKGTRVFNLKG